MAFDADRAVFRRPLMQQLTPLLPDEIAALRVEYDLLPVHDPRRRLLLMLDNAHADLELMRRLVTEDERMFRELRSELMSAVAGR